MGSAGVACIDLGAEEAVTRIGVDLAAAEGRLEVAPRMTVWEGVLGTRCRIISAKGDCMAIPLNQRLRSWWHRGIKHRALIGCLELEFLDLRSRPIA